MTKLDVKWWEKMIETLWSPPCDVWGLHEGSWQCHTCMAERKVSRDETRAKNFDQSFNTAAEESWGPAVEGQPVIIQKDKWMCRRGSTFSNAISSSHLLLGSFQVDSLQDTASIFRGDREGNSKCMLVSEAIYHDLCLSWRVSNTRRLFVFLPSPFICFCKSNGRCPLMRFYSSMGGFSLNSVLFCSTAATG